MESSSGAQIDKSKRVLHESYCVKNLYRCHCGKVVEKKEKATHDLEFHTPVKCAYCGQEFDKPKLAEHLPGCPKKPKACEFCELEVAADAYPAHVAICGSKTVQCPTCHEYIPKRDWPAHQKSKCRPESEPQAKRIAPSGISPPHPSHFSKAKPSKPTSAAAAAKKKLPPAKKDPPGRKPVAPKKPGRRDEEAKIKGTHTRNTAIPGKEEKLLEQLDREAAERLQLEEYQSGAVPDLSEPDLVAPAPDYRVEQLIPDRPFVPAPHRTAPKKGPKQPAKRASNQKSLKPTKRDAKSSKRDQQHQAPLVPHGDVTAEDPQDEETGTGGSKLEEELVRKVLAESKEEAPWGESEDMYYNLSNPEEQRAISESLNGTGK